MVTQKRKPGPKKKRLTKKGINKIKHQIYDYFRKLDTDGIRISTYSLTPKIRNLLKKVNMPLSQAREEFTKISMENWITDDCKLDNEQIIAHIDDLRIGHNSKVSYRDLDKYATMAIKVTGNSPRLIIRDYYENHAKSWVTRFTEDTINQFIEEIEDPLHIREKVPVHTWKYDSNLIHASNIVKKYVAKVDPTREYITRADFEKKGLGRAIVNVSMMDLFEKCGDLKTNILLNTLPLAFLKDVGKDAYNLSHRFSEERNIGNFARAYNKKAVYPMIVEEQILAYKRKNKNVRIKRVGGGTVEKWREGPFLDYEKAFNHFLEHDKCTECPKPSIKSGIYQAIIDVGSDIKEFRKGYESWKSLNSH